MGQRLARYKGSDKDICHNDHLGSLRALTHSNGTNIGTQDYYPYGDKLASSSYPGKYTYNGKEYLDDWGFNLYYYGARFMDPVTGRFITPDPVKDYSNQYSYVGNNPVNRVDPTGMWGSPHQRYSPGQMYSEGGSGLPQFVADLDWSKVSSQYKSDFRREWELVQYYDNHPEARRRLKEEILSDHHITPYEALLWGKYGGGEDLGPININNLDFRNCDFSSIYKNGNVGDKITVNLYPFMGNYSSWDDGIVYGSITLYLNKDENGLYLEAAKTHPFNFDMHDSDSFGETIRNIYTYYARDFIDSWWANKGDWHDFNITLEGKLYAKTGRW